LRFITKSIRQARQHQGERKDYGGAKHGYQEASSSPLQVAECSE
jgi:hypothetical protein